MKQFRVIKNILNIRTSPGVTPNNYAGSHLNMDDVIWADEQTVTGTPPPGFGDDQWYKYNGNYIWHSGVVPVPVADAAPAAEIPTGSFDQKLIAFAADDYNVPFFIDPNGDRKAAANRKVSWGHIDLEIWKVWKQYGMGDGVRVAVIDSGCWSTNNDLKGRISQASRYYIGNSIDSGNPVHGTKSAGIIGAGKNNRTARSVLGVAPGCEVIMLKTGENDAFDDAEIFDALTYAITELKPSVISISVEMSDRYDAIQKLISDSVITAKDPIIILASSGNSGAGTLTYPSGYDGVFCVGAYMQNGDERVYNNVSNYNNKVSFLGPGKGILTTGADYNPVTYDDTSAATAFSAGIIALAIAASKKKLDFSTLMNALRSGYCCDKLPIDTAYQGYGIINPMKLINYLNK